MFFSKIQCKCLYCFSKKFSSVQYMQVNPSLPIALARAGLFQFLGLKYFNHTGKNALRSRSGWVIPVSSITLVCSITFFSSQAFVEKKYGGMAVWSIGWLTSLVEHLHPSLHLVPTKPGSACLWSLSSRTGWSMLWPIVKLFQSWCSVKLWLMARSGLTRHPFGFMDVVSTKSARCMDWIGQEYCSCRLW